MARKRKNETSLAAIHPHRILAGFLLAGAFLFLVYSFFTQVPPPPERYTVDVTDLKLEIADTDDARRQGLSGRETLAPYDGMLFVFDDSEIQPFWMKDMKFPLDLVWISRGEVVEVVTLQAPEPDDLIPPTHIPTHNADRVLELNAGEAEALGLEPGVIAILPR